MFNQIEKEYKKQLKENKFNKFYWSIATILALLTTYFKRKSYIIYIILAILVIIYFIIDFKNTLKNTKINKNTNIFEKFDIYRNECYKKCIDNLIANIKKYNIKTKNDIKLTIDYFNNTKPIKVESNFLGWIVSAILTISSFIQIAYDSYTQSLDYHKLSIVLSSSLGIFIVLMIPIIFIKIIITNAIFSKEKLCSNIIENLTYIYLNFNKYKNQLNK